MLRLFTSLALVLSFLFSGAQDNQNIEIAKLASGNFLVYKVVGKSNDFKFELAAKPWPVTFTKVEDVYTEVIIKRAGIIEEKYQVDLPGYPAYYKTSTDVVITIINKKIYYYNYSIKTGSTILYVLSESKVSNYDKEKDELDNYLSKIKDLQTTARTERIEENKALAKKEAKENTLEGKFIKEIKVKLVDPGASNIGMLSIVGIGFEAVLTDGTILKTKNLGGKTPYIDFDVNVSGGQYSGGDLKVAADSREIPGDRIEVEAWSKFSEKKVVGKLSHPINYNSEIFYQYQGVSGVSGRGMTVGVSENGGDGKNGKSVRILAEKLTVNGSIISYIRISDASTGQVLAEAKLNQDAKITINVSGGNGGSGVEGRSCYSGNGGSGGTGGDAGDVYLSGSATSILKITVLNDGGKGGIGGTRKTSSNTNGTSGSNGKKGNFYK